MRTLWIVAAAFALIACASEATRPVPTRTDSAGVSVVSHAALDTTLQWTLTDPPFLSIGVIEGDDPYLFSGISGIARLSDGRIAVGEARAQDIRIFDGSGRFVSRMGGIGEGPGEFRYLQWFRVVRGDTILAWDGRLRRFTSFDHHGDVLRTSTPVVPTRAELWSAVDLFSDRSLVIRLATSKPPAEVATMLEDTALYARWHPASPHDIRELLRLPVRSVYIDSDGVYWPVGFMPHHALVAAGDRVYSIEGDDFEIREHDTNGELRLVVRVNGEKWTIPPAALQLYKDSVIAAAGSPLAEGYVSEVLGEMPFPETYPALDRIHVDTRGRLWVREYPRPSLPEHRWHIFDLTGEHQGSLRVPVELEILAIRSDTLLGQWTDQLGVVSVRGYAILW